MVKRVLAYVFVIVVSLVGSFFTGYYTTLRYTDKILQNNLKVNDKVVAQTAVTPKNDFIGTTTDVIERVRYTKGVEYLRETKNKAGSDIIGMDMTDAEKYFKDRGYLVVEFTPQEVIITKDIDGWPPGMYVVKSDNDVVNVYKVSDKGELTFVKSTEIALDELPEQDKQEVIKGKIYNNMDDVDMLIDDYNS